MAEESGPPLPVAELPELRSEPSKSTISASRRVRARIARRMTAQRSAINPCLLYTSDAADE